MGRIKEIERKASGRRKRNPVVYLICEGSETEIRYFKKFRSRECNIDIVPIPSQYKSADKLVQKARATIGYSDDYLFVAGLLQEVRDIHKKMYYDVSSSKWIRGHSEIPYIHLDFVERPALKKDEFGNWVPDDKKLNMRVKPPLPNGTCRLEFDYYWLKQ